MLAEFLLALKGIIEGQSVARKIESEDARKQRFVINGSVHEFPREPQDVDWRVETIDDLVPFIMNNESSVTFVDENSVVVLLDGCDGHERVRMPLAPTNRWHKMVSLSMEPFRGSPAQAIKMLRFDLSGSGNDALINALRNVDFERSDKASSVVKHGDETFGRKIEAKVQQVDKIPEEFIVTVPMFTNHPFMAAVRCGVHIDASNGLVEFHVLADELDRAQHRAINDVHKDLVGLCSNRAIYRGQP